MSRSERAARAMTGLGGAVSLAAAVSPRALLGGFGIAPREVTGTAAFGWRLFAVRTAYLSAAGWRGDEAARRAFLPVQLLDQAVFWHAYGTRSIPRRAAALAAGTSGAIVALDLVRRTAQRGG